jgi:hypothetical protein
VDLMDGLKLSKKECELLITGLDNVPIKGIQTASDVVMLANKIAEHIKKVTDEDGNTKIV